MKKLKTILLSVILAISMCTTPVAGNLFPGTAIAEAAVKINKTKKTLSIGDTYTLKISGTSKKVS